MTLICVSLFMRMINNATNEITYGKFQELVEDGGRQRLLDDVRFISNCSRQTRRHRFLRCRR
ncbi:MAG: hypothetical protein ACLURV_09490 [Gallintestinimicrobium sp.]